MVNILFLWPNILAKVKKNDDITQRSQKWVISYTQDRKGNWCFIGSFENTDLRL